MEYLFQNSGIQTYLWLPPLVAFIISFFTSMGGISGAFLLIPFQINFLGFTSPAVTPTNLIYNIVAIPGGLWRFLREGRMVWPLTYIIVTGSIPGVMIGCFIRLHWLPYPIAFKAFVGCVLSYIGVRLFIDLYKSRKRSNSIDRLPELSISKEFKVKNLKLTLQKISYCFQGQKYIASSGGIFGLAFIVGIISAIYGIGGGAIIAPFLITVYKLPVHTIAGATLMSTFITSIISVFFYQLLAYFPAYVGILVAPDWLLGTSFGIGGICGVYLGTRFQRFIPAKLIKIGLGFILFYVGGNYLFNFLIYILTL